MYHYCSTLMATRLIEVVEAIVVLNQLHVLIVVVNGSKLESDFFTFPGWGGGSKGKSTLIFLFFMWGSTNL